MQQRITIGSDVAAAYCHGRYVAGGPVAPIE
jgi:hypothetical protein